MKKLLVIIGLLVSNCLIGQSDILMFSYDLIKQPFIQGQFHYIVGINQMKSTAFEIGIARGLKREEGLGGLLYSNYHLCSEVINNNSNLIIGTKLGFSSTLAFLNYGIQFIDYTDFKSNKFNLRPEVGASFIGIVDLVYGFNIDLDEVDIDIISKHVLALRYTIGSFKQKSQ